MRSVRAWVVGGVLTMMCVACDPTSASPTEVVPPAASPAATTTDAFDSLRMTCDGRTTEVDAASVQAAPDGVHLVVTNTSENDLTIEWTTSSGEPVSTGTSELVLPILPGRASLTCHTGGGTFDPAGTAAVEFRVVPPDGWVEPSTTCRGGLTRRTIIDYVEGATGVRNPFASMTQHAPPGAEVVPVGYRTATDMQVGMLVDGRVIEVAGYRPDGAGGWLVTQRTECSD